MAFLIDLTTYLWYNDLNLKNKELRVFMTNQTKSANLQDHVQFWEDRETETLEPMSFMSLATFEQENKVAFSSIRETHVRNDSVYVTLDTMLTAITRILGTDETFAKLGLNAEDLIRNTVMTYIVQIAENLPKDEESLLALTEENEDVRALINRHFASVERLLGNSTEGESSDE